MEYKGKFGGKFGGKMELGASFGAIKCPILSDIVQNKKNLSICYTDNRLISQKLKNLF